MKKEKKKNIVIGACSLWSENSMSGLIRYLEEMASEGFDIKLLLSSKGAPTDQEKQAIHHFESHATFNWTLVKPALMKEWIAHIDNATLVISGKYHDIIASLYLKTPFITLDSDTPQIKALLKMTTKFKALKMDDLMIEAKLLAKTSFLLDCSFNELELATTQYIENLAENNLIRLRKASPSLNPSCV